MPYWDENDTDRLGYNKDSDGNIAKYSRLTGYYDQNHDKNENHGHEVLDTATGVYGYRGENADRSEFRSSFDDVKFPNTRR